MVLIRQFITAEAQKNFLNVIRNEATKRDIEEDDFYLYHFRNGSHKHLYIKDNDVDE
jgi:hypothetical protein